jgi:cobyrinic acid a,c-diamide synthase
MMTHDTVKASFIAAAKSADISIIEGAMGLYDGLDLEGSGSTAQIAKIIKAPVLLVIDTRRMTRSVAAIVKGFAEFDPQIKLAGVILNQVARARHEKTMRDAIEKYCKIPVVGAIPKDPELLIPDRQLGLIAAEESEEKEEYVKTLKRIRTTIENHLDLELLLEIAQTAPPLDILPEDKKSCTGKQVRVGVIRDQAFNFYYPENLEELKNHGAELTFIDSIRDSCLPPIDALYLSGGVPDDFAAKLERNRSLRADIKQKAHAGLPIYAEGGGLLYLGQKLVKDNREYEMAGVFSFTAQVEPKFRGHGYTRLVTTANNALIGQSGITIKGHESHNTKLYNLKPEETTFAYQVEKGAGINARFDGLVFKNVLASYNYIHALSTPRWAKGLITLAKKHHNDYA